MDDRSKMLASEKIGTLLFKLSAPATVGMLVQALYNLVDTFFVGRAYGTGSVQAIGGIAVGFPIQMIIMAVSLAIGIGGSSIISRSLGAGNQEKADKTFGNIILLTFGGSVLLTASGLIFIVPLLKAFGATPGILPYALEYMQVILSGTIFFAFALSANNVVRSEGNAKVAMFSMLLSAGLNTVLDPLFIFGFEMGVKGAAIATVIAQVIGAGYLVSYFMRGQSTLCFRLANLKPDKKIIKETFAIGLSPFMRNIAGSFIGIILNNILAIYGGDVYIALFGIANRLFMITFMPMFGIVQGLQPIVGFNYGAGNLERVRESIRLAIFVSTGISVAGFALLFGYPEELIGLFSKEPQLIEAGKNSLRIMVLAMPLVGFQVVGASLYQALGKAKPSLILTMSRQILFLVPLVIILPRFFNLTGVWAAFPISDTLAFVLTLSMIEKEFRLLKSSCSTENP